VIASRLASRALVWAAVSAISLPFLGCASTGGLSGGASPSAEISRPAGKPQTGFASYYGTRQEGRQTASGDRYDGKALTAAHRTLPFGTRVRVTNLDNEKSVVVRINDRGPFVHGRIIDLSRRAAEDLGFLRDGTAKVRVEVIGG
jgi:rare lipoprotein A